MMYLIIIILSSVLIMHEGSIAEDISNPELLLRILFIFIILICLIRVTDIDQGSTVVECIVGITQFSSFMI